MHDPKEVLAVCEKATEGPWKVIDIPGDVTFVYTKRPISASDENICIDCSLSDANFIALARTALPEFAQRIIELEEINASIRNWNACEEHLHKTLLDENANLRVVAEAASLHVIAEVRGTWDDRRVLFAELKQALATAGYGGDD